MHDRLMGLKNILWAIGIVLCLILLFIGLVFSAATPYHGSAEARTPDLNAAKEQSSVADVSSINIVEADGELHSLRETNDAGAEYISSSVFLTDSIMISLREQSLTGGDVWSSESGSLPMGSIATWNILYSDGSKISPVDACMISKPSVLFIAIGSDGVTATTKEDFIAGYDKLIRDIMAVSPDTKIVCCSVCPVADGYSGKDGLTDDIAGEATEWVCQVCRDTGAYYADIASAVRSGIDLTPQYAGANKKALNSAGLQAVLAYLRTHAVP